MSAAEEETLVVERDGWKGYADLVSLLVPIDSVEPHPENPRRGNVEKIATSLAAYGQTRPLVVQASTGRIVAGNHTRRAALERLGWTEIAVVRASLDDDEAVAYLMMDNAASDDGGYDDAARIEILDRLREQGRLDAAGYSNDELDALVAAAEKTSADAIDEFERGRSEPDPETPPPSGEPELREVVLILNAADYGRFTTWERILRREWSLGGPSAVVLEALRRAAESA